jgi:predicted dehydrogenase
MAPAAAALAAPWVLSVPLRGASAPSNRINLACIGTGRQAVYSNIRWFLEQDDCRVLVVCDVDAWRLGRARELVDQAYASRKPSGAWGDCAALHDWRDALALPQVDAVMISTPDHWHVPMAIAAARAGKDVCCEKPLTLSIAEGRALADAVRRHGRVFRTDSEFRSLRVFQRACELVRNGAVGRLHAIRTGVPRGDVGGPTEQPMSVPEELDYDLWLGPAPLAPYTVNRVHPRQSFDRPGWMRCRDSCEGMITNWGAHLNDIAQWGHGTEETGPVRIEGRGTYPRDGLWNVLTDFEVEYRFADGVRMIYAISRPYVRFEGDAGWVEAAYGGAITASSEAILRTPLRPGDLRLPLVHEKRDWLDCIRTRGRTLADAEVGHRTTSLCQLGHIAIQVGRPLAWDPAAERFADDAEANRLLVRPMRGPWRL